MVLPASSAPAWTCLDILGRGRSVCEVMHKWSSVPPQLPKGCSSQTKILFLLKPELQSNTCQFFDIPDLPIDSIFTAQFAILHFVISQYSLKKYMYYYSLKIMNIYEHLTLDWTKRPWENTLQFMEIYLHLYVNQAKGRVQHQTLNILCSN